MENFLPSHNKFSSDPAELSETISRLLAGIPSDIFVIDTQGGLLYGNASFIATLNPGDRDIQEVVGDYSQQDQSLFNQILEGVIENGETTVIPEYAVTRTGGEQRTYQITLQPFAYRSEGKLKQAILGTAVDVTAYKRSTAEVEQRAREIELLHSAGQQISETLDIHVIYRTFFELVSSSMSHDSLFISSYDAEEELIYCRYAIIDQQEIDTKVFPPIPLEPEGMGTQSVVIRTGKPLLINDMQARLKQTKTVHYINEKQEIHDVEDIPDDEPRTYAALIVPLILSGEIVGVIQVLSHQKDAYTEADLRLLQALASQIAVASNNALLYEQAQQEIAERKKLQAELEKERNLLAQRVQERTAELSAANQDLQQALKVKDEFLAIMSHELRTPLNAILGMGESMALGTYGPLDPRQEKPLAYIQQSGEHLLALINDVLNLTKIQTGKIQTEPVQLSLEPIVRDSINLVVELARKKEIKLHFDPCGRPCIVGADERQLKQVLLNLLSNAIKFTDPGGSVGVDLVLDEEAGQVKIIVWDTGIGIRPEDHGKLFKPFVQLDSGLSRKYEGTGLGLALSAQLVELNGGSILVESEGIRGKGSRFTVVLPRTMLEADKEKQPQEPDGQIAASAESLKQVLLVEDNLANLEMMKGFMAQVGCRVMSAEDGEQAVDLASNELFDIILMDIQLPVMDGLEAIRRIKRDGKNTATPIIALTALAMPGDKERCLEAGADRYVAKPVNLRKLLEYMTEMMS